MADIVIPRILPVSSIMWSLRNTSRSGGVGISGGEQVVQSPSGRWTATMTFNLYTGFRDPSVLLYRSLVRRGRAAVLIVPEIDTRGPAQWAGLSLPHHVPPLGDGVPLSDGSTFSDGTGYGQGLTGASFAADAALNATQILVAVGTGLRVLPSMRFSTPDGRLHEVDDVLAFDGGTLWTITVAPWLRAAYPAGTPLDFDTPVCRMRLASDDTGPLTVNARALGAPSIDLVEDF